MSVLKTRTITGVIFGAAVLLSIWGGYISAILFFGLVILFSSFELARMLRKDVQDILMISTFVLGFLPFILSFYYPLNTAATQIIVYIGVILFLVYTILMLLKVKGKYLERFSPLVALTYLGLSFFILRIILLKPPFDWELLLSIILLIWTSDTFAYLIGSQIGKHKIYPAISPGKSWEGFIGAGVFVVLVSMILNYIFGQESMTFYIFMGIMIWIFGLLGDFFESYLKRYFNLKDSGSFLPGHGGFLDRFDSFIFCIPFVGLMMILFNMI